MLEKQIVENNTSQRRQHILLVSFIDIRQKLSLLVEVKKIQFITSTKKMVRQ